MRERILKVGLLAKKGDIFVSRVAVIIPSHNEPNVKQFVEEVEQLGAADQICIYNDAEGRGKGYAIREALKSADGDYYIFIDGDGDIKADEINKILHVMKTFTFDIVVGKKELPHRFDRKLLTWASRLWVELLFGLKVDTQTGLKGFKYKPEWKTDGWAFDIEILYNAKKMGKNMIEVAAHATVSSTKSFRDIWTTLIDTIKIRMGL